jgi:DNA polymerase-3 subunit epsilon
MASSLTNTGTLSGAFAFRSYACAGMRRRYPGHKSYSLDSLCEFYQIDLEDHHRALCDARAAAHLLNLFNQKRGDPGSLVPEAQAA